MPDEKSLEEMVSPFLFKGSSTASSSEQVYNILRNAFMAAAFGNSKVLTERAFAKALHVSRTPVREALNRLTDEGLAERVPNRGIKPKKLTLQSLGDIYETRSVLEGLAAKLAATRASSTDIAHLNHLIDTSRKSLNKSVDISRFLNTRFHIAIAEAARNTYLADLISRAYYYSVSSQSKTLLHPGRPQMALEEHEKILRAIEAHDPQAAEKAAQDHLQRAKEVRIEQFTVHDRELLG